MAAEGRTQRLPEPPWVLTQSTVDEFPGISFMAAFLSGKELERARPTVHPHSDEVQHRCPHQLGHLAGLGVGPAGSRIRP